MTIMKLEDYALLNVKTEILPSDDAQARMAPSSWGAQETELTIAYIRQEYNINNYIYEKLQLSPLIAI